MLQSIALRYIKDLREARNKVDKLKRIVQFQGGELTYDGTTCRATFEDGSVLLYNTATDKISSI